VQAALLVPEHPERAAAVLENGPMSAGSFRKRLTFLAICALVFVLTPRFKASPAEGFPLFLQLPDGTRGQISFSAEPEVSECRLSRSSEGKELWACSEYNIELSAGRAIGENLLAVALERKDGTPFSLHHAELRFSVPYAAGDGLWSYNTIPSPGILNTSLEVPVEIITAPNIGIPLTVLVDRLGVNKLALGLLRQDRVLTLRGELTDSYSLSIETKDAITTRRYEDTFYVSRAPQSWFQEAHAYTRAVDHSRGYTPLRIPESAYDPTYDSWYFTGDDINQDLVWELAVLSQETGFKSYLLDAGWDTTPGEYSLWLDGSTGDYRPDPYYFPDFSDLLRQIRSQLRMKVMFWMQQFAVGRRSIYYADIKDALTQVLDPATGDLDETVALCPRVSATRQHMVNLFERIMDDYQPDALWFDWQEQIPVECSAWHVHDYGSFGEGYNATQQTILRKLRERDSELFVELRWPFANLNNKPYAHLWQPIDSPQNFHSMRLQAMNMRAFSSGVAIGTDEMYWRPEVSDAEAARFMATVVFTGVPYFGPDLRQESASRRKMLRAWLDFYLRNKSNLIGGTFEPYGDVNQPDQKIESPETIFIYYANPHDGGVSLRTPSPRIVIVNASPSPGIDLRLSGLTPGPYRAEISDIYLNPQKTSVVFLRKDFRLELEVPVGCLLTLTRMNPGRPMPG
jgi:hypothetical protein